MTHTLAGKNSPTSMNFTCVDKKFANANDARASNKEFFTIDELHNLANANDSHACTKVHLLQFFFVLRNFARFCFWCRGMLHTSQNFAMYAGVCMCACVCLCMFMCVADDSTIHFLWHRSCSPSANNGSRCSAEMRTN